MAYPNVFQPEETERLITRIEQLTPATQPQWGKMNVAQMLAHCCVPYELALTDQHPKPSPLKRWLMRNFVKGMVVSEKPFPKNSPTAKEFLVPEQQDFEQQKERLIGFLRQVQTLGKQTFEGRDYPNFGRLTASEWSNLMYKHLNHHLEQFGV